MITKLSMLTLQQVTANTGRSEITESTLQPVISNISSSFDLPPKRSSTKSQFKRPGLLSVTIPRPESPIKKYLQPTLSDPHPALNKKSTSVKSNSRSAAAVAQAHARDLPALHDVHSWWGAQVARLVLDTD